MAASSTISKRPTIVEDFIRKVRAALTKQGMSVTELAAESGVSREYIHRLLAGTQNPSLDVAERIAKPLGLIVQTVVAK